jgi:hypothetical protein
MAVRASAKTAVDLVRRSRCLSQAWLRPTSTEGSFTPRATRVGISEIFGLTAGMHSGAPGDDSWGADSGRPHGRLVSQVDASSALLYGIEGETMDTMRLRCRMTPLLSVCSSGRSGLQRPLAI